MADIQKEIQNLYSLEEISAQRGFLQSRAESTKFFVTLLYLICLLSIGHYDLGRTVSFIIYPLVMIPILDVSYSFIFRRSMVALPFVLFAGISNLIFDKTIILEWNHLVLYGGELSFLVLLIRSFLSVSAIFIFVASTSIHKITGLLRSMHVPEIVVMLFEMTYRYIAILSEEANTMLTAYRLRSNGKKWPEMKEFGSFIGQLLLRSQNRAENVYQAMKCRLYPSFTSVRNKSLKLSLLDVLYLLFCTVCIIFLRLYNISEILGGLFI